MSEYPPGSFVFEDRIMDMEVQEALREAQARRLQQRAGTKRGCTSRLCYAALVRLGQRLIVWGKWLQDHISAEGSASSPWSAA